MKESSIWEKSAFTPDEDMRLTQPVNPYQQADRDKYCPGIEVGELIHTPMNLLVWSSRS